MTDTEAALARAILLDGPISRARLTTRLGLSPASLTRLAKPFLDRGIFIERSDTAAAGSVGRPSRPLDMSPALGRFVGVKLTGDRIYAVLTDVRASLRSSTERALSSTDPEAVADLVAETIARLDPSPAGIGVCLGGSVADGVAQHAPFLHWEDVPFADILRSRVSAPVVLENDVVALAEAERWFGFGRGQRGFVLITIGAGVGYTLVVGDDVIRSANVGLGVASHLGLDTADDGRVRAVDDGGHRHRGIRGDRPPCELRRGTPTGCGR